MAKRLCLMALAFLGLSLASAAEKVKLGTPIQVSPIFSLPMLAAEEQGFWKQEGVEVEWVPFTTAAASVQALAAGAIQMGLNDALTILQSTSRGVPVVLTANFGGTNEFFIWVPRASPIKGPADLKGKKLDVTRLGAAAHAYALAVARALGQEKEIRYVGLGGIAQKIAGLKTGVVDAVMLTIFTAAPLVATGELRQILAVKEYLPKEWMGRAVLSRRDFLTENVQTASKISKALIRSANYVMGQRQWAIEKMQAYSKYSREAAEITYPFLIYSKDGRIDRAGLANVRQFLLEYRLAPAEKVPPLDEMYVPLMG